MENSIVIGKKKFDYLLRYSKRAKRLRLSVYPSGLVTVTLPLGIPTNFVSTFLSGKVKWIEKYLARYATQKVLHPVRNKKEYLIEKKRARILAENRLLHFNKTYGFSYGRISIRDQRTRWGSCSKKGNLNFNYRIALLPSHLADYIVVHELCHLGAFDHSQKFWDMVAQTIPEHRELRRELRAYATQTFLK